MTPTLSAEEMERELIARAIWSVRREYEDRCDMELEDLRRNHSVWLEADAVRATLARHPQPECGDGLEVRGLQWLDTGHYRKKPPQFGYNPHDWNELCLLTDAQRLVAQKDAEIEQLSARVAELEAKLSAPSFYWHDDENGAVESPEEWAEMQYGMTGEAFSSTTLRCAIELPEREFDSIEFDEEGNCISIRYVGEVARLNAKPAGEVES